jgi:DMSO/TMAO reductase YedYZ heme-binding membrane subunit
VTSLTGRSAITIDGVIHYYHIVKSNVTYPLFFAVVMALLLAYRVEFGKGRIKLSNLSASGWVKLRFLQQMDS